eukprot:TRINITY_DN2086_c0_g6_i1.p1 TRINITY_DN2086_c0_g6~~TRINITY_DN2086_c0_g6_i1.p1  ORF type:complete len:267 (+),score=44.00 TRINITY_DN2086_c0_g6_i1:19-819(+)
MFISKVSVGTAFRCCNLVRLQSSCQIVAACRAISDAARRETNAKLRSKAQPRSFGRPKQAAPKPKTPEAAASLKNHYENVEPIEDIQWARVFHTYKAERLQLRSEIWAAHQIGDWPRAASLALGWKEKGPGGKAPLPLTPAVLSATSAQQQLLASGQFLVPGMCFVHKELGFRAAIVGCDPMCSADGLKSQPFYHCIVDAQDRPADGQLSLVAEQDIELSEKAFPIEGELVELLLVSCPPLRSYLPGPKLEKALKQQLEDGGIFSL